MQSGNLIGCSHSLRGVMVATLNVTSNEDSSPWIRISCRTESPFIHIDSSEHHPQRSVHRRTSHGSGEPAEDWEGEFCNFLKTTLLVTTCVTTATSSSSARPAVATPMMLYTHPFGDSLASTETGHVVMQQCVGTV